MEARYHSALARVEEALEVERGQQRGQQQDQQEEEQAEERAGEQLGEWAGGKPLDTLARISPTLMLDSHSSSWEERADPASGAPYYFNRETGVSVWERPLEMEMEMEMETGPEEEKVDYCNVFVVGLGLIWAWVWVGLVWFHTARC